MTTARLRFFLEKKGPRSQRRPPSSCLRTTPQHFSTGARRVGGSDVMLRGHTLPRPSVWPYSLPPVLTGEVHYNDTCSGPPPHRRGRLFCMGVSAQFRVHCPKARTSS